MLREFFKLEAAGGILLGVAALGGLILPALIYGYMNWQDAQAMRGWAIPAATDIAFAAGLFFGKQIGIMAFTAFAVALNLCKLPIGVNWKQYYGMALLTGIGFTMSLFIGTLAFDEVESQTAVRLGVLLGSALSGVLGYIMLRIYTKPNLQKK